MSPHFLPVRRLRGGDPTQVGPIGEEERDPVAPNAPELHAANTAKMPPESGETE